MPSLLYFAVHHVSFCIGTRRRNARRTNHLIARFAMSKAGVTNKDLPPAEAIEECCYYHQQYLGVQGGSFRARKRMMTFELTWLAATVMEQTAGKHWMVISFVFSGRSHRIKGNKFCVLHFFLFLSLSFLFTRLLQFDQSSSRKNVTHPTS